MDYTRTKWIYSSHSSHIFHRHSCSSNESVLVNAEIQNVTNTGAGNCRKEGVRRIRKEGRALVVEVKTWQWIVALGSSHTLTEAGNEKWEEEKTQRRYTKQVSNAGEIQMDVTNKNLQDNSLCAHME
jgi:hypothetical protein